MEATCYLFIPENVVQAALGELESGLSHNEREIVVRNWVNRELEAAQRGQVLAYVVDSTSSVGTYSSIEVKVENGTLVRRLPLVLGLVGDKLREVTPSFVAQIVGGCWWSIGCQGCIGWAVPHPPP